MKQLCPRTEQFYLGHFSKAENGSINSATESVFATVRHVQKSIFVSVVLVDLSHACAENKFWTIKHFEWISIAFSKSHFVVLWFVRVKRNRLDSCADRTEFLASWSDVTVRFQRTSWQCDLSKDLDKFSTDATSCVTGSIHFEIILVPKLCQKTIEQAFSKGRVSVSSARRHALCSHDRLSFGWQAGSAVGWKGGIGVHATTIWFHEASTLTAAALSQQTKRSPFPKRVGFFSWWSTWTGRQICRSERGISFCQCRQSASLEPSRQQPAE